jgi:hypothetical protein
MDGERTHRALQRIDVALSRLEAIAARPAKDSSELEARHAHLRDAVSGVVGKLDALIAGQTQ